MSRVAHKYRTLRRELQLTSCRLLVIWPLPMRQRIESTSSWWKGACPAMRSNMKDLLKSNYKPIINQMQLEIWFLILKLVLKRTLKRRRRCILCSVQRNGRLVAGRSSIAPVLDCSNWEASWERSRNWFCQEEEEVVYYNGTKLVCVCRIVWY